jgi:hypothetical protein
MDGWIDRQTDEQTDRQADRETGWAPEPVWTQRLEEKSFAPVGDRTPIARSSRPELPRLREKVQSKEEWRRTVSEAKDHPGLQCRGRTNHPKS